MPSKSRSIKITDPLEIKIYEIPEIKVSKLRTRIRRGLLKVEQL